MVISWCHWPIWLHILLVIVLVGILMIDSSHAASTSPLTTSSIEQRDISGVARQQHQPWILFSDVDGTLVHYPEDLEEYKKGEDDAEDKESPQPPPPILILPPSSTGMVGIISEATLRKCQILRRDHGVKLVLMSGMRASTLWARLPYLPKADAYGCEGGGRIFYPIKTTEATMNRIQIKPIPFEGADPEDLEVFTLVEDLEWRQRMEQDDAAGPDGFVGHELDTTLPSIPVPLERRRGRLWEHARSLVQAGLVLDLKGCATCIRVNRKHQAAESIESFEALVRGELECPPSLATTLNLGAVDFYPAMSGKKNCCLYLAQKFGLPDPQQGLAERSLCLCDDDNDLEMAMACRRAYLPSISSKTMEDEAERNPAHFTKTFRAGRMGVLASDTALDLVLEQISS